MRVDEELSPSWCADNGNIIVFLEDVEVLFVDVPEIDDLAVLLEKDVGWTQKVGFVDRRLVEM